MNNIKSRYQLLRLSGTKSKEHITLITTLFLADSTKAYSQTFYTNWFRYMSIHMHMTYPCKDGKFMYSYDVQGIEKTQNP